jgi:hypothetical protein
MTIYNHNFPSVVEVTVYKICHILVNEQIICFLNIYDRHNICSRWTYQNNFENNKRNCIAEKKLFWRRKQKWQKYLVLKFEKFKNISKKRSIFGNFENLLLLNFDLFSILKAIFFRHFCFGFENMFWVMLGAIYKLCNEGKEAWQKYGWKWLRLVTWNGLEAGKNMRYQRDSLMRSWENRAVWSEIKSWC